MPEKKVYMVHVESRWGSSQQWSRDGTIVEAVNKVFGADTGEEIKRISLTPYEKKVLVGDHTSWRKLSIKQ